MSKEVYKVSIGLGEGIPIARQNTMCSSIAATEGVRGRGVTLNLRGRWGSERKGFLAMVRGLDLILGAVENQWKFSERA